MSVLHHALSPFFKEEKHLPLGSSSIWWTNSQLLLSLSYQVSSKHYCPNNLRDFKRKDQRLVEDSVFGWMVWFKWQPLWMLRRHRGRSGMSHGEERKTEWSRCPTPPPWSKMHSCSSLLMMSYFLQEVPKASSPAACQSPCAFSPSSHFHSTAPSRVSLTSQTSSDSCLVPSTHPWPTSWPVTSPPSPTSPSPSLWWL